MAQQGQVPVTRVQDLVVADDAETDDHRGAHRYEPAPRAEVALHAAFEDCWIIIRNKVYDFTEWKDHHPGGPFVARMYGGKPNYKSIIRRTELPAASPAL
jgi:cytochrome b involved in lipid metabolism